MRKKIAPVHPGEIILEEYLKPLELSQNKLSKALGVPPRRINEIVLGKRRITADTAIRLSKYFSTTPEFWLSIQMQYDLESTIDNTEISVYNNISAYNSNQL